MKNSLHLMYNEYRFEGITRFMDILRTRKCTRYASDFLQVDEDDIPMVEDSVKRTMEIFKTLQVPIEDHFYKIYRGRSPFVYKDWKLSELACIYMLMNGDPTDVSNLAHQQNSLIDQMLTYIHPDQLAKQG